MTNEEIARKLSYVRHLIDTINAKPNKTQEHMSPLHAGVTAYNAVREAIAAKLKTNEMPSCLPSNWRDALEIQLLFAEEQLLAACRAADASIA